MHAHDGRVYHLDGRIMSGGKCVHDPPPHSGPSPPDETAQVRASSFIDQPPTFRFVAIPVDELFDLGLSAKPQRLHRLRSRALGGDKGIN